MCRRNKIRDASIKSSKVAHGERNRGENHIGSRCQLIQESQQKGGVGGQVMEWEGGRAGERQGCSHRTKTDSVKEVKM